MTILISILRGINVSGQKLIKMELLKRLYEGLGFENIITYVQSGNVVFNSKKPEPQKLQQIISRQIKKDFGFDVPVIVLTCETLQQIIENNPFLKDQSKDPTFLHITFLSEKPKPYNTQSIEEKKQNNESIAFSDNAIYLYCPDGYGRTKLSNNFIETKLKVTATTRNWKTTMQLSNIAQETRLLLGSK